MDSTRAERLRRRIAQQNGVIVPAPAAPGGTDGGRDPGTVPEAFAELVRRLGQRPAVRCEGRQLTYRQLDEASTRLAAEIAGRAGPDARPVGILLRRSLEMIVAALAAVKTGACYVPLDPVTPAGRVGMILADADPSLVVTTSALAGAVPSGVRTLCLDEGRAIPENEWRPPRLDGSARAYVIFTSGTTGRPKGVQVSHASLLHLLASTRKVFDFDHTDVWVMAHSFGFDFAVWETWGPLLSGGCLVIASQDAVRDPAELRRLLRDERVTTLNQTPKAFNQLIEEDLRHADRLPLARVLLGGEALRFADLRPWVAKNGIGSPRLINIYGPSEATVISSYYALSQYDLNQRRSLIGRPLPGLDFVLVDESLAPAAAGALGEIVITGPAVAIGYVARADLTRERFVEVTDRSGRVVRGYRTGDLAALTAEGEYEYRGRNDDQVKIRGFRVEPGEVEAALSALPAVAKAAVLAHDLPDFGMSLVAYVVPAAAGDASADVLRGALADLVPEYMIPRMFLVLDDLPLTHHGKLDRQALPEPVLPTVEEAPEQFNGARVPDQDVEARILNIGRVLLHNESLAPTDDFFAAGGHSLLVTRLLARVRSVLGVDVPLRVFFRDPTIRGLAAVVREELSTADPAAPRRRGRTDVIHRAPAGEYLPLTSAQQRLYFIAQLDLSSTAYHLHTTLQLDGPLDAAALESAFSAVLARHAPLRTVVRRVDGRLVARVQPATGFHLAVEELVVSPGAAWRDRLADRSQQEWARPFDLERDLMLRARLFRIGPDLHALVVTMHHIAGDGWSIAVLSRELKEFYQHYRTPSDAVRPVPAPLPYSYADFAHSFHLWLESADAEPDIDYWIDRLADLPDVRLLPADKSGPTGKGQRSDSVRSPLDASAAEALRRLCRQQGVTMFMLMEAAFAVLWARRGAGPDVVFGTVAANRSPAEFDELIGMFVNTLVVRVAPGPDEAFPDLLARVRLQTLEDLDHQHVPFDVLVKRLNPKRSGGETPLFQAMLVVQNNESMILELDGLDVTALDLPDHTAMAKVDVLLEVLEQGEEILLRWTYNADLFHRETVTALAEQLTGLLAELAAARPARGSGQPARTVGLFPLRQNAGEAAPVFALPGGLGLGSSFVQLSSHFTDRSFNALHTRELIDSGGSDLTLEVLIDSCVRTITGSGDGPVHLVGHSIGGPLAFRLVDALRRGGREVLSLVLLDPSPPTGVDSLLAGTRRDHLRTFLGLLAESFPGAARRWREQALDQNLATERSVLLRAEELLGRAELDLLDGSLTRAFDNCVAILGLRWPEPEPIACPTLVLAATAESHAPIPDHGAGWERCVPGCLVRQDVPTTHEGILRNPAAEPVAALMSRFMLNHESASS